MSLAKKLIIPGALVVTSAAGVAGGSLLTSLAANAASDTSGATSASTGVSDITTAASTNTQPDPTKGGHQANGITETVLTGDNATKATAAAQAAVPGATVIRAETDADGDKYEVHMKKSDGSLVTVKLDANFKVTSTENGMGAGGPGSGSQNSQSTNQ
jgi:uncharacterized membrane protein YkoI